MLESSFPQRDSNSFNLCRYIEASAKYGDTVRFALKCIIALAILYRAILLAQGGSGAVVLSAQIAGVVPAAQTRVRDEIADRLGTYCRSDPDACLERAARLTSLVAPAATVLNAARPARHGAVAAAPH